MQLHAKLSFVEVFRWGITVPEKPGESGHLFSLSFDIPSNLQQSPLVTSQLACRY